MTIVSIGPLYIGTDPRFDLSIHLGRVVIQWDWSPSNHGPAQEESHRRTVKQAAGNDQHASRPRR